MTGWLVASVSSPWSMPYAGWTPCMKWCAERFDQHNWRYISEGVFEFRHADDHMMFLLKWA
jgi:hypothetical protein